MLHLYPLHDRMQEDGVAFCYTGFMTDDVLVGIGRALKQKMDVDAVDRSTARGLYSVFVEMVQNVARYSAERHGDEYLTPPLDLRYGILAIGTTDDRHFVACGNLVQNKDVVRLTDSLNHIQSLDRKGIMKLYKETLRGEISEGSKGAGVGFLEIARQANNGLEFDFEDVDIGHKFFTVTAYL